MPPAWQERLQRLAARFHEFGIGPDFAALAAADLYGVYRFLSRAADGG
jgi:hypothetical protein